MTNEEWQLWWDTEWQRRRAIILRDAGDQKWQKPDTWDPVHGYCFDPEKLKEYQDKNFPIYVGSDKWKQNPPPTFSFGRPKQAIQPWRPEPPPPGHEDEMRYRMASASDLDSQLPRSIKTAGDIAGTAIGWAIAVPILCVLGLLFLGPLVALIGVGFVVAPVAMVAGLAVWLIWSAIDSSMRSAVRTELEAQEKRQNKK